MDEREIQRLIDEARDALQGGNFVRVLALTEQLQTVVPDDPATCALRAEALLKTDAGEESLEAARRAVELEPDDARLRTLLGLAAWRAEKLSLAQESLERAVELSGEAPRVVADFAFFMAAARGPRLAEAAAEEAICADPKCAAAWAARGLVQLRRHRRRAAEATLKRALELDPNDPYAQAAMLALLYERRDTAGALALARLLGDSRASDQFVAARLFFRSCGLPDPAAAGELEKSIADEARKRRLAGELIQRRAVREATFDDESRWLFWFCVVLSVAIVATQVVLAVLLPDLAPMIILFGLIPLLLLWALRRFLD